MDNVNNLAGKAAHINSVSTRLTAFCHLLINIGLRFEGKLFHFLVNLHIYLLFNIVFWFGFAFFFFLSAPSKEQSQ